MSDLIQGESGTDPQLHAEAAKGAGISRALLIDFEIEKNLVNLFNTILEVDRRINPHLYVRVTEGSEHD